MAVCHCCVSLQLGILKFIFCIIVLFTLYFVFYFVFCNGRLALPLLCTGLNLFIGLTVGHYMQWGQLTVGCHHMQWWPEQVRGSRPPLYAVAGRPLCWGGRSLSATLGTIDHCSQTTGIPKGRYASTRCGRQLYIFYASWVGRCLKLGGQYLQFYTISYVPVYHFRMGTIFKHKTNIGGITKPPSLFSCWAKNVVDVAATSTTFVRQHVW